MRYGPEHKQQSRARIVRAAAQALRTQGAEKLGIGEVMAAAGLTHGGFYAHFPSKDALVAEALATMFREAGPAGSQLEAALAGPATELRAALRNFLSGYLSPAHRDGATWGCPLPALANDVGRGPAPLKDQYRQGVGRITARIGAVLSALGHAAPDATSRAVVSRMVGAVALARALGPGPESDAVLADSLFALKEELGL